MGRSQNLRPDRGRHGTHHALRRQRELRRVDVAIHEKRHMPDADLRELQQDRWRAASLRVRMIYGQRAVQLSV